MRGDVGRGATVIAMLLLLLTALAATAQQPPARDTAAVIALDTVNVSVLRRPVSAAAAPAAVSVVERSRIQEGQLTIGLDEALVGVPGLNINNRYNESIGSRLVIRGFGARAAFGVRGVRVIADGIPLTMPDGQSNLTNLDLGSASRIEVIRGPASAMHGNAAGGVVLVQSERAPADGFSMQARAIAGTLDGDPTKLTNLRKLQVKAAGRSARADWTASISRQEVDGYRVFSASRQTQLNLRAGYAPDDVSRLTFVVNAVDQPRAQSPGALPIDSVRVDPRMAWPNNVRTGSGEQTRQGQAGIGYTRSVAGGRLDVAGYVLARSVDNPLPFGFIELSRRGGGLRATWSKGTRIARWPVTITAGADAEVQSDDRREYDNAGGRPGDELRRDQVDRVATVAPFVQAELQVTSVLAATLGGRYDAVRFRTTDHFLEDGRDDSGERTLGAFSPMAGLVLSASPATRVYANVATSFQTPTTTELINAPPSPGGACCPAGFNTRLEPQRAVSYEAGVKGEIAGRVAYDVAVYRMDVKNALVPFQVPEAEGRDFFRNSGETRHRGVEIGASGTIQRLSLSAAYTYSDFFFVDDGLDGEDFEGNEFPGVPPHHLFLGARLDSGRDVTLDSQLEHTSAYFATDANDPASLNPAATVIDLRVLFATRIGGLGVRPFLALNNVFDERYNSSVVLNAFGARYFEPAPGRNLAIGLTLGTGGWAR